MGWFHCYSSRAELIQDLTRMQGNTHTHRQTLKHTLRGNVLWSVMHVTMIQSTQALQAGESVNLICCDLLRCIDGEWGYKSLSEADRPFYYSCPLSYLDLAPVVSVAWRERVRAHHAARRAKKGARK